MGWKKSNKKSQLCPLVILPHSGDLNPIVMFHPPLLLIVLIYVSGVSHRGEAEGNYSNGLSSESVPVCETVIQVTNILLAGIREGAIDCQVMKFS